jgi:hypothetical protein
MRKAIPPLPPTNSIVASGFAWVSGSRVANVTDRQWPVGKRFTLKDPKRISTVEVVPDDQKW